MTNIIYFYKTLREYYSSSSFSSVSSSAIEEHYPDQTPPQHHGAVAVNVEAPASSLYTAIGEARLPCARPPIQFEQQEDDDDDKSTTATIKTAFLSAINQQDAKIDEEESSQTLSSPTPQCSTFKRFDFAELRTATRNFYESFDFAELRTATRPFRRSVVYKGWVDEHQLTPTKYGTGIAISVKFLIADGFHDLEKWLEEAIYLGHLHHPNLVRLLGYCIEDTNRLVVYEHTSLRSLENLFAGCFIEIHRSRWLNFALDAAKGLAFIHSSKIIHGHFKPSNVLLDSNYNAKLLFPFSPTTFPIGVMETPGGDFGYTIDHTTIYDAPEYLYTGESQFSAKSDVYSFGVVFLEILFGQRAFEKHWSLSEQNLVEWIKSRPNLKYSYLDATCRHLESREKAVRLVLQCLSVEVKLRPTMDEVVKVLEELLKENNRGEVRRTTKLKF